MTRLRTVVIGLVVATGPVAVGGCAADCTESDGPRQESPDGRHTVLAVHRSCGGAAGAEEDLVYVVSEDDEQELALRIHHQVGPLGFTWTDADRVTVALSEGATLVQDDSPAGGVDVAVTSP